MNIQICKSCGRDNAKSDPCFRSADGIASFYEPRCKRSLLGNWMAVELVDCLTNCDSPNSVKITAADLSFDFGWISTKDLAAEVLDFARALKSNRNAKPSTVLQGHLLDHTTGRGKTKTRNHPLNPPLPRPVWLDPQTY